MLSITPMFILPVFVVATFPCSWCYLSRSRNNSTSSNQSASPGHLTKRWNSTGDFNAHGLIATSRFTTTKSLLNLYSKPSQNGPILKHG
ncbi:hypothetical protein evm_015171 [Chilo suppressalis]|nr:hypothetical protein evm_015171 [Chilo suppressalis]